MSRGAHGAIRLAVPGTLGDCEVGLRVLRDESPGPVLTFSVGWEFVGVWDGRHCCAVLDRALLRLSLTVGVETSWTVDELSWWSSSVVAGDYVLVGLSGPRDLARHRGAAVAREPEWWRLPPGGLAQLRERV